MKSFITHIVTLALLAALLFSVITGRENITAVVVCAYWVLLVLAIFVCVIVMGVASLAEIETDPVKKARLIKLLNSASPKPGILKRTYNWIFLALIVCGLAYAGWVFTAVCYAIIALMVRLCLSIARDKVEEYQAA